MSRFLREYSPDLDVHDKGKTLKPHKANNPTENAKADRDRLQFAYDQVKKTINQLQEKLAKSEGLDPETKQKLKDELQNHQHALNSIGKHIEAYRKYIYQSTKRLHPQQ